MGSGIVAMSGSNRQDSDIWVGWSRCSNLPTRRNCESTFCPVIARSDSDEAIPARMKGELPRGVYPEPFPNCHPERSKGSQGKGRDSLVAFLPQNDTGQRAHNDRECSHDPLGSCASEAKASPLRISSLCYNNST